MNCSSCGAETNGIKINGKQFCPVCGDPLNVSKNEVLDEFTQSKTPKAKRINPKEDTTSEIDVLNAEEEILELIEKEVEEVEQQKDTLKEENEELPQSEREITKANRHRIGHKKEEVVTEVEKEKKEEEPEVQQEIPETEESETSYPLLEKSEKENLKKSKNIKKDVLRDYFQSSVATTKKPTKKKKHSKKPLIILMTLLVILLGGLGFLAYVNLYALNPDVSLKSSENALSFTPQRAGYLPPGYEFTYAENASSTKVIYHYSYLGSENRTLDITEEDNDVLDKDIYQNYVASRKAEYLNFTQDGLSYWYLNGDTMIYKGDLLYQIHSSAKMTKEELLKIAEGLSAENNNISR